MLVVGAVLTARQALEEVGGEGGGHAGLRGPLDPQLGSSVHVRHRAVALLQVAVALAGTLPDAELRCFAGDARGRLLSALTPTPKGGGGEGGRADRPAR